MKRIALFLTVAFLLLLGMQAHAAVWPISGTITPDSIGSDYGPRNVDDGSSFHYGLDFFVNTVKVKSITSTTISEIKFAPTSGTGNYVKTTNGFRFLHLSQKTSDYEIRKGYQKKSDGTLTPVTYIVFKDSGGKTIKVLSTKAQAQNDEDDRFWYDHDNNPNTENIKEPIASTNSLAEGETFAYSGSSGTTQPHLHIDKGNKGSNPLRDLPYTASPSVISIIEPQGNSVEAGEIPIKVEVKSAPDFDLNEVTVTINGDEKFHPIIDKPVGPKNVVIRKNDKETGVHPIKNGVDRFIYVWKASTQSGCTPPTGRRLLRIQTVLNISLTLFYYYD